MIARNDFRREEEPDGHYTLWPNNNSTRSFVAWIEVRVYSGIRMDHARALCYFPAEDGEGYDTDSETLDTPEEAEAWAIERVNQRPAQLACAALSEAFAQLAETLEAAGDTAPDLCEWLAARGPEVVP
jgi:hypothetical protein